MALPADVLGTEYRALSRPGISPTATGSQVTIVGTEDNTTATITTKVAVPNVTVAGVTFTVAPNAPFNVVLNRLQTFLLQLQVGDLTGTLVTADQPIAVFSGNQNGTVTDNAVPGSADHMVEQMVPVNAWGNEFIVAPIAPNTTGDSIVRVLAHYDGTIVTVNGEAVKVNGENKIFAAGTFHEFTQSSSSASLVGTSKPALVAQYKEGDKSGTGPFVMLVPPVRQFSRQYLFATPLLGTSGENHQLNIVVKEQGDEAGLLLDFAPLPAGTTWTAVNGYRYATVPIPKPPPPKPGNVPPFFAAHLLEHQEPSVRFGAWAYGHALGEGYGYAAGQLVNSPPICSEAVASTPLIWPPNQELVSIGIDGVFDPNSDDVTMNIDSIFQDEPTNDTGDGNTAIDGSGVDTTLAQVRAERSGGGNGRVYHIGFTATDTWGASCSGGVTVGVPSNQGRGRGGAQSGGPVDDGALYDSTAF